METRSSPRLALLLYIAASTLGVACTPPPKSEASDLTVGDAQMALELSPGVALASVGYTITGPASFSQTGSVDVASSTTVTFVVGGLPAQNGFQIAVTAVSTDGMTSCGGGAMFDVAAGTTTQVPIHIDCHETPRTGSVQVNGSINVCPAIVALPAPFGPVTVGSQVSLSATAHDLDGGPAALTYAWSATAGLFDAPTSPATHFTCTAAGTQTVTLVVSDGDTAPGCAASQSISVECVEAPPTCSFSNAPPPPASGPVNSAQDFATVTELAKYDSLIGRFLRGDVTVYRGTVSAQGTQALNDSAPIYSIQTSIPDGAALAMLDIRATYGGDWYPSKVTVPSGSQTAALVVHSLPSRLYLAYGQDTEEPGLTWGDYIEPDDPAAGVTDNVLDRSCSGCAPSFWTRPGTIAFDGLVTSGSVQVFNPPGMYTDVPVSTTSSVHLTAAAPCSVGWSDLAILDTATGPNEFSADLGLRHFQPQGGLYVAHDSGSYVPVPPTNGVCVPATLYSVELWVDPSDLSKHGVRNFVITMVTMVCGV
jgi:hypothetical protein